MKHTLERHRFFPIIAWVMVICFAVFVGHLSLTVSKQITNIEAQTVTPAKSTISNLQ